MTALVRSSQACCYVVMTKLELTNAWPNTLHTVSSLGLIPKL